MILWLFPQSAKVTFPFLSIFPRHQHSAVWEQRLLTSVSTRPAVSSGDIQHKQTALAFKRLPTQAEQSEQLRITNLVLTVTWSLTTSAITGPKPGWGREKARQKFSWKVEMNWMIRGVPLAHWIVQAQRGQAKKLVWWRKAWGNHISSSEHRKRKTQGGERKPVCQSWSLPTATSQVTQSTWGQEVTPSWCSRLPHRSSKTPNSTGLSNTGSVQALGAAGPTWLRSPGLLRSVIFLSANTGHSIHAGQGGRSPRKTQETMEHRQTFTTQLKMNPPVPKDRGGQIIPVHSCQMGHTWGGR